MKKRLAYLSVLICSILCMFGCGSDPYKNMTLEYSGSNEVKLEIEETTTDTYVYNPYSFYVKVGNVGDDVNKSVDVSGGEEFVDCSYEYVGSGKTKITVTPKSYAKTGKFTLVIQTLEGNKTQTIDFQIDLKINNFTFNSENLQVITKGQSIDLNAIDKYINFYPAATTQKNIEFQVVRPEGGTIDGNNVYEYDDENNTDVYAKIENNILTTYKTNAEGESIVYPQLIRDAIVGGDGGYNEHIPCITLRAHSLDAYNYDADGNIISQKIPDRYIDIIVIDDCDELTLKMNCEKNDNPNASGNYGDSFTLEKNDKGEYDVVLLNPNYGKGMIYGTYYIERDLMFDFGTVSDSTDSSYNPDDYYITTTPVLENENKPIVLSYSQEDNSFKVQAQTSGTYSHKFVVDHKKYPGIIDREITVNFIVKDIPTDIKINGTAVKDEYSIYKNYNVNTWGTRFTVSLTNGSGYNYFVYVKDQELGNNLQFFKADGTQQVLALYNDNQLSSLVESADEYSTFKSNETFYMRHKYETLPNEGAEFYIGVKFDVTADSYSEEIKEAYFNSMILGFKVNISFEIGVQSIDFTQSKYVVDLTNGNYTNGELDETGIKLFDLPAGQSIDSVVDLSNITYDKNLISVYPVTDYAENRTSFYVKGNQAFKTGSTTVSIVTKNGIRASVGVETLVSTMYVENENLEDYEKMPLSIGFSEDDLLYYFSGKTVEGIEVDPKAKFEIYKTTEYGIELWEGFEYTSLKRLFMIEDTSISLKFYDYLLAIKDDEKMCEAIDITDLVTVAFNYPNYASYSNGKLTVNKGMITENINNPVKMYITYNARYIRLNDEGIEELVSYPVTQEVELYIYLALQGVQVTTAKSVDIYVDESLGMYSKDLAKHTIESDFIPNEVKLGAQWNNNWFIEGDYPVDLWYDIDTVLNSPIYLSDGSPVVLYSNDGSKKRELIYGDLFAYVGDKTLSLQVGSKERYKCPIQCRVGEDLTQWIINESGYGSDDFDWFVKNRIFDKSIVMVVNVYITQFSKLQNINSVKFNAKYASKISNFSLDVENDGVYFEKRNGSDSLVANIAYRIDATEAVNKEILLINADNVVYNASVKYSLVSDGGVVLSNDGIIKIVGNNVGLEELTAVPKDNIKYYDTVNKEYVYYNKNLVQTFRVKIADGSEEYPFEIRSIDDYSSMKDDVASGKYYNYILTQDLNLSQLTNAQIVFANIASDKIANYNSFSLNGNYSYRRNGIEYSSYNSLNNLSIRTTVNNPKKDVNIGLIQYANQKVTIKNLFVNNAKIEVTLKSANNCSINIGLLAGNADGMRVYNSSVLGSISIYNASASSNTSYINIGGMIGKSAGVTVSGLNGGYLAGYDNNMYNANVSINYKNINSENQELSNILTSNAFNVGGIIGLDNGSSYSTFRTLKVLPNIVGTNYTSNVGGFIGKSNNAQINGVDVYPIINISDIATQNDNILNVSTFVGSGGNLNGSQQYLKIANSRVFFIKEGYENWSDNLAVIINSASIVNFGGLVGNQNQNNVDISYSYIRSFHSEDLDEKYYANIYINAKNSTKIGGLVGLANSNKLIVASSYFNADILANGNKSEAGDVSISNNIIIGTIVADLTGIDTSSSILDSYAISRISATFVDNSTQKFELFKGLNGNITPVGKVNLTNASADKFSSYITIDGTIKSASLSITMNNVYTIISNNTYYFGKSDEVIGIFDEDEGKLLVGQNGMISLLGSKVSESNIGNIFKTFGYSIITDGKNVVAENNEKWLWNGQVNLVSGIAFPVLLNNDSTQAIYDLIPERILIDRVSASAIGVYDASIKKNVSGEEITVSQLIVFLNKNKNNNETSGNYFDIALNSDKSTVSIKFDGQDIMSSFLNINGEMIISEDSKGQILELNGYKVYPKGEGIATITIMSALDKTVRLDIVVKVVPGITSFDLVFDKETVKYDEYYDGREIKYSPTVYIDEILYLDINNKNIIGGVEYESADIYGYKIEAMDGGENGKVIINDRYFNFDDKSEYILNTKSLVIKGVVIGNVKFRIYPIVYKDGLEYSGNDNYIILENIYSDFVIVCKARANDIYTSKEEITIAPKNTSNFSLVLETSNVIIEHIEDDKYHISILDTIVMSIRETNYEIGFKTVSKSTDYTKFDAILQDDGTYVISALNDFENVGFNKLISHQLIKLEFGGIEICKVADITDSQNTYQLKFNCQITFDKSYYRKNANDIDLSSINYVFSFVPDSNTNVTDSIKIGVVPNKIEKIYTNYYARGELLQNTEMFGDVIFSNENESHFVIPGTNGLLKITLDEEFNDSSYITVTLDNEYKDYITIGQLVGVTNYISDSEDSDNPLDYIYNYNNVKFKQEVSGVDDNSKNGYYGIKLAKTSLNYLDESYFRNTYYVKLFLKRDYGNLETVKINITSYGTEKLTETVTYSITQLPLVSVKVDDSLSAVLGKGVKKELEISARGIVNDIAFEIQGDTENKVTIRNDENIIVNTLEMDYINSGRKYYVCADVTSDIQRVNIVFKASEIVEGITETTKSTLVIDVVQYELKSIQIQRAIDGVVTIKHGESLILNTSIEYKDIIIGDEEEIEKFKQVLRASNKLGLVELFEYASVGAIIQTDDKTYGDGVLRLAYETITSDAKIYSLMDTKSNYDYVSLKQETANRDGFNLTYYAITGTGLTLDENVNLRLYVPYVYKDGVPTITESILGYSIIEIDFAVVVEDSSTYDRPNPIETTLDLINACKSGGGNYILLNNLELTNWTPIDATFSSLDGNGYKITVKSFNFNGFRNQSSANVGIFSTVSENSLLKNIIVDVSSMLITQEELLNRINKVSNSNESTYLYDANIDLAFIDEVNFGILAGVNYGAITNARIINTIPTSNALSKMYYHVVTTQGYVDDSLMVSNIGGLVGINEEGASITNSYVGINAITIDNSYKSTILMVNNPSEDVYNNIDDNLESVEIYPFTIAGGNNLAGIVATNKGIISNSYTKALGLYNSYPAVRDSSTGGLASTNDGLISNSFVESLKSSNYRAVEDKFTIESAGNIGGFVYQNNGNIDNCYSNVFLETQSAFTGGFVFENMESGNISNSYTTNVNRNNTARGQFTGVGEDGVVRNSGVYSNCYYIVLEDENINNDEYAKAITKNYSLSTSWRGFSFTTQGNSEGMWYLDENELPKLTSSAVNTNSFRRLVDTEEQTDGDSTFTIYTYQYITYNLGSKENPLIIDSAEHFAVYIIDSSVEVDYFGETQRIFGVSTTSNDNLISDMNAVRYIRLVNNLDFDNLPTVIHKNTTLYNLIFAGVFDGNGMTLKNLNINTLETNNEEDDQSIANVDNFGLFGQIGVETSISKKQTVVKNLKLELKTFTPKVSSRAGVLAGTIVNSTIVNVSIDGNLANANENDSSVVVSGINMAGALAGLIYADEQGTIYLNDITVQNIAVEASNGSLGGQLTEKSKDESKGLYKTFSVKNSDDEYVNSSFISLYDNNENTTQLFVKTEIDNKGFEVKTLTNIRDGAKYRTDISYAGGIAGVILANNNSVDIGLSSEFDSNTGETKYRSKPNETSINNLLVKGNITIKTADNSGGLFGYIGENTLIKSSKFEVGSNQVIRSFNFAGGIVAENHGVIEQSFVALADDEQDAIDALIVGNGSESNNSSQSNTSFTQIFDSLSSKNYTVAIGGIAGYSSNGVIIDCYSKVNVTKPRAYIAGGIIGYSENYNYIAFSYSSGAVYAQDIIGGIVGLQVTSDVEYDNSQNNQSIYNIGGNHNSLALQTVYAITNWNATTEDFDFRQNITQKLYDNQKVLYKKSDGTYYYFYVKMPEIGNLNIAQNNSDYASLHNSYYVGSAIGYLMTNYSTDVSQKMIDYVGEVPADTELSKNVNVFILNNFGKKVVTNTLGLYSSTGSLATGDKVDSYDSETFNYYLDVENYISMHSFRIAYDNSSLNAYDKIEISTETPDTYFDVFTYPQIFYQEYTEQMLGAYYQLNSSANRGTASVFRYEYEESDRFDKTQTSNDTIINRTFDYIWALYDEDYLPQYSYDVYESGKIIETKDDLVTALTSVSNGKLYEIMPSSTDYTIDLGDITDRDRVIKYAQTIRDMYVGRISDTGAIPTIKMNITGSNINSLFNNLVNVSFKNLNFEITFNNSSFTNEKLYDSWGIFANSIQNSIIKNCTFNITINNDMEIKNLSNSSAIFNANNVGLIFGEMVNTTINSCTFNIKTKDIHINEEKVTNFGMIIGYSENSSFTNNNVNIVTSSIINDKSNENANISGIIAVLNSSTIKDCSIVIKEEDNIDAEKALNITNNCEMEQLNVSALFASANNSNILNISSINTNLKFNNCANIDNINISQVIANSSTSVLSNIAVGGGITATQMDSISDEKVNVGSVIANNIKSSSLGNLVSSSANINVNIDAMYMNVGGLIGLSYNSPNLIDLGQFTGEIIVNNQTIGKTINNGTDDSVNYPSQTMVGGIVGKTTGITTISNVLSMGNISVTTKDNVLVSTYVGGIIGCSQNCDMENFTSLATIKLSSFTVADVNVAGVIAMNNGVFMGINGFVLVELPKDNDIATYAITNNSVSASSENVFYCNELMGGDYDTDSMFNTYALADLYDSISEYSLLGEKIGSNDYFASSNLRTIGNLVVIIPKGTSIANITTSDGSIYLPNVISSDISSNSLSGYNVVLGDNVLKFSGVTVLQNAVLSGRTMEDGNATITQINNSGSSDTVYAFTENYGVISNIYFKTFEEGANDVKTGYNVALVYGNYGVISQVYAYGITKSAYSLAYRNNESGMIVKSASATIYQGIGSHIYGLVDSNNGLIADCYSSSFAHTQNSVEKANVYGVARLNDTYGIIQNVFYYIPEEMLYENSISGVVSEKEKTSSISNAYNSMTPSFANYRDTIWTTENEHSQIYGFKDIEGAIVIQLKVVKNGVAIYDLDTIKTEMKAGSGLTFGTNISFYSVEKMKYNVERFKDGNEFQTYINSLKTTNIPANTIVMLEGSLNLNSNIRSFSIPETSMIVGLTYEGNKTIINYSSSDYMSHEFIKYNFGVFANIEFMGLKMNNTSDTTHFAPIMYNYGIIYEVSLKGNSEIRGGSSRYVAGIIAINTKNGYIVNCTVSDFSITSVEWFSYICLEQKGTVVGSASGTNLISSGKKYAPGIN